MQDGYGVNAAPSSVVFFSRGFSVMLTPERDEKKKPPDLRGSHPALAASYNIFSSVTHAMRDDFATGLLAGFPVPTTDLEGVAISKTQSAALSSRCEHRGTI